MERTTNGNGTAGSERVFVVESCRDCKKCCWHTRQDEQKYLDYFSKGKWPFRFILFAVSAAICERVPGATVLRNQIPKSYLPYDLYCNLIPNKDQPDRPVFDQVPRTGAFEVSYKGMVSPRILPLTHFLFIIVDLLQAPGCLLA